MVKATLLLFKEAYKIEENEYFILLSDKCIPLYTPQELYTKINNLNINLLKTYKTKINSEEHNKRRFNLLNNKEYFNQEEWYHQSQWMLLKRETVKFFIENDFISLFGEKSSIADEHYFVNIMKKYNINYENQLITFVNWKEESISDRHRKKPRTYDNLTNNIINDNI